MQKGAALTSLPELQSLHPSPAILQLSCGVYTVQGVGGGLQTIYRKKSSAPNNY